MKHLVRTLVFLVAAALAGCAQDDPARRAAAPPRQPLRLTVMTYNIHHGEGTDGRIDLERIARVVRDAGPDLVALQEVDVKTRRSGGVDQAAELGRLTGMRVSFGRAIDYQGGEYGQAILSRFPLQDFKVHVLPGDPASERRAAVSATVRPRGEEGPAVNFAGTHLHHLSEADRLAQADEINRLFAPHDDDAQAAPTILVGDLNARPDSRTMAKFFARWRDAAAGPHRPAQDGPSPGEPRARGTYPASSPDRRIDYILLRPPNGWRVEGARVVEEAVASDHRPVVAVVVWERPRDDRPRPE